MDRNNILKLVNEALEIGESSKHFVSVSLSTSKDSFTAIVYIMNKGYNGVKDTRYFNSDLSWQTQKDWLIGWKSIIETEREEDEANKS